MPKIYTVKLGNYKFSFLNFREFLLLYFGIFILQGYKYKTSKNKPMILDCGSHIGMSILYFKKHYPKAKIIGFEPNPKTFTILKKNVSQNNLKDVKLVNSALGDKESKINLFINKDSTWSWGDSTHDIWYQKNKGKKIKVKQEILSEYIKGDIDLIKLNIEFSENKVLREISDKLGLVKEIFLQYHYHKKNKNNNISEIYKILDKNNFKYEVRELTNCGFTKKVNNKKISNKDQYFLFIKAKMIE